MVVRVSVSQETENMGSCMTREFSDDCYEEIIDTVNELNKIYNWEPTNDIPDEVLEAFENLTAALECAVETWDDYVENNNVWDILVDHVDVHLNNILVEHLKLADTVWIELD